MERVIIVSEFKGFHQETLDFLADLRDNNNKQWFDENRDRYEKFIMEPSRAFVISMGELLHEISEEMNADPRVNKSLFRMNRDVRFSNDKSPYKSHVGIIFWEGPRKRMECPGFYFHIEPEMIMLAGGFYQLPKDLLEVYRHQVEDPKKAEELSNLIKKVESGGIKTEGLHYKRMPRGFSADHEYSDLLLHTGVHGIESTPVPEEFFSADLLQYAYDRFRIMDPLNRWFLQHLY